jgi:urea carboxylase
VDGPSLGGFVCPVTVVQAQMWKLGQLKPMDTVRFIPLTEDEARTSQEQLIAMLQNPDQTGFQVPRLQYAKSTLAKSPAILLDIPATDFGPKMVIRRCGDRYVLIEYGPNLLDLDLRFRVHAMMEALTQEKIKGIRELSPGVRSLQIFYEPLEISTTKLIGVLSSLERQLPPVENMEVKSRIVHLPLVFQGDAVLDAVKRYQQSVRSEAPYLPSNIEFIRRINGLDSTDDVEKAIYDSSYLVLGLGDVYLGAPCAVPVDPRHRIVTSKYNPARTYTPEGVVGIGGVYMCIYGMDSPGGYQLVGRTVPIWNKFMRNSNFSDKKPWLLRFFDEVRFYPMEEKELDEFRHDFRRGKVNVKIEDHRFNLKEYHTFLETHQTDINQFLERQKKAFDLEKKVWAQEEKKQILSIVEHSSKQELLVKGHEIRSEIAGNVWQTLTKEGDRVIKGQTLAVLESMKMEFKVISSVTGTVSQVACAKGRPVTQNSLLFVVE